MKLLTIVRFLLVPFLRAAEMGACAALNGGGSVQTRDSWDVYSDQVVENQTIQLNGMLDIHGGVLTLRNVNLEINSTQAIGWMAGAVQAIKIGPGARLVISNSRIAATSAAAAVVLGDTADVDHTCFTGVALFLSKAGAAEIRSNEFELAGGGGMTAITLNFGAGAVVENNNIRFAIDPQARYIVGNGGISLTGVHDSAFLGNTIVPGYISLEQSWNNHVAGNTSKGAMVDSGADALTAKWWSVTNSGWLSDAGIFLEQWSNNNVVENNTLMGAQSAILLVHQSAYNTISHNTIMGAGYGVVLRWASHTLIDGNEMTDVYDNAVHAHKSHDNTITNNHIYNAGGGVALYASENNVIQSNTVADADRAVFLHESSRNTVDGNTVSGAVNGLFVASNSSGNGVTNNNIVASDSLAWDDGRGNLWKGNFWGKVSNTGQAIPPAAAADAAPAPAMLPLTAAPVRALAPPSFNGPLNTTIDIQNQQVWQDARTLNAAIVIEDGGSLTLKGAALTYVVPQPTSKIWIEVMAGGSLDIEDSKLIGPDWDHALAIKIYKGGHFTMKNSEMRNAGSWVGTFSAAISAEADGVDIENNTFVNVYCAFSGEGGAVQNTRFVNNTIIGAVKGIVPNNPAAGAVFTGNRVSRYGEWGSEFGGLTQSRVTDNLFSDGWGPAVLTAYNATDTVEFARKAFSGIAGPGNLVTGLSGTDFRQVQTTSRSISPVQAGDGVETEVTLANISYNRQFFMPDWAVFAATLTANDKPVETRNVMIPMGQFERIRLKGPAGEAGPYGISIQGSSRIGVSKTALRFAAAPGSQPAPQVVAVANTPSDSSSFVWSAAADSAWLRLTPPVGANAGEFYVDADASGLASGTYTGNITVTTPGQAPEVIAVTLWVTSDVPVVASKPSTLSFSLPDTEPAPQTVALSLTPGTLAFPFSVSVRTEHGGNWLTATADAKSLPATVTVSVNGSKLAPGQYTGEVLVSTAGAANSPLEIPVSITVPSSGPGVTISSVVNGASYLPGFAASSWLTITGANLSRTTRAWNADDFKQGSLPTSLDGVSVVIDGCHTFLDYVSPTQLNLLAPFDVDTASDTAANVTVIAPDGAARTTALKRRFAPGVFVFGGSNAEAVHTDGALVCAEGSVPGATCRAATPGEVVQLYLTGLGTGLDPAPADGVLMAAPSTLRDPVVVTLGGIECPVQHTALVSSGLYQINMAIPDLPTGSYEVIVRIGGAASQPGAMVAVSR